MNTALDKNLRVAIIGTGMVAATHLRALADLSPAIRLKGVLSRQPERAKAFAAKACDTTSHTVVAYDSLQALCDDKDLDFVIVLTPPNARLEIAKALAAAGKHILMEKPVERSAEAAADIVAICEKAQIKLGVVFQFRMRAASRKLASLLADGSLGDLAIVETAIPWWREQSYYDEPGRGSYERDGGGVLISQAIHALDLMLSLTGPVSEVQAMASTTALHNMESEDYVSAGLRFANGAIGSLIATTASFPGSAEHLTLHCKNAVAKLQSGELTLHWRDGNVENYGESATTGGGADPMAFTHEWHRDIIEDFAAAVRRDQAPVVTGQDALQVHRLIDALIDSSKKGRIVSVN